VVIFLIGCGTSKKVAQLPVLPDWVQNKPVSTTYYNGIGSAPKVNPLVDFQEKAKNKALADLSSEITVSISSKSVLHRFESSLGYSEDYISTIKSESKEDLEGYELMQTFETETQYYVWYRLSKENFQRIKEQRKLAAINKALDYYAKAQNAQLANHYLESITNYIKGLESVKPYLSDALDVDYRDKPIYLGNELFSGLLSVINDIKIVPIQSEIFAKNGMPISSDKLKFSCINGANQTLADIPIVFSMGQRPLLNSTTETDITGTAGYSMNKLSSANETEFFVASVDFANKASQITSDPIFRKMLRKIEPPKGQIILHIASPSFFVYTNEKNLGKELISKIAEPKLKQLLAQSNLPLVMQKEQADFVMELNSNTTESTKNERIHYAQLKAEVKVFNAQGQMVFIKPIDDIRGAQLNYMDAGLDAYQSLSDYLSKNLMTKLNELVK